MARVTGPLMSFDASGTVAGAVVFSKWRGRNYVRRHAVPSNPRTTGQLAARAIIAFLGADWKNLDPADQATWEKGAESLKISSFNEYIRINARDWRDQLAPSKQTPATRASTAGLVGSLSGTPSGRQAIVTVAQTPGSDDWGMVLCRSLSGGFTATPSNAIQIAVAVPGAMIFVDGPLPVGAYYYNARIFTVDGDLGADGTECQVDIV